MTNPRGAGTTYFHELAHMIDHASCNYRSNLSNTPEPKIDNEYYEIEEQYFRQFGHGVPREMLPDSISTEQIKQAMKKCILNS